MITKEDLHKALAIYISSSKRSDIDSPKIRLSELEPSSVQFLETKIKLENGKEIHRLDKTIIYLEERIKKLEDNVIFEDKVAAIVTRRLALLIGCLGGLSGFIILLLKLFSK